ncbi:uncharacterized protein LOC135846482 [Planococcus citri]|uniref:uncharacterized protein LOC135846482 n=1 Tax=Planococcus citri TaxID=170843 RepID=UPI0031F90BDF
MTKCIICAARYPDVNLRAFPRDINRRKQWFTVCNLEFRAGGNQRICISHFSQQQLEMNRADGQIRLKPNAVPDQCLKPPKFHVPVSTTTFDNNVNNGDNNETVMAPMDEQWYSQSIRITDPETILAQNSAAQLELNEDKHNIDISINESSSNNHENSVTRELSKEDQDDEKAIKSIYGDEETKAEPCCPKNCNFKIPKNLALQHRYSFQELDKKEKDLVVLSHLQQHRRITSLIGEYAKLQNRKLRLKAEDSLTRQGISYYFCDLQICKKMYFFLHDLGRKEFRNLVKHYDEQGLTPRVHKLTSVIPCRENVLKPEDIENIVSFIKSYGEQFGRHMPRRTGKMRTPQFKNYKVIGLPEDMSKTAIYNKYCEIGTKPVKLRTFFKTWNTYCPYIISLHRQATNKSKSDSNNYEDGLLM